MGLRPGTVVTPDLLAQVEAQAAVTEAKLVAMRLLAVRSRSRTEIARALARKGYQPEVIEGTVEQLLNLGLIDDELYAQDLARSLAGRKRTGRKAIIYKLRQNGVDAELAERVVQDTLEGVDETERARAALAPKLPKWADLPPVKLKQKAWQFLARLGFEGDTIAAALRAALADD